MWGHQCCCESKPTCCGFAGAIAEERLGIFSPQRCVYSADQVVTATVTIVGSYSQISTATLNPCSPHVFTQSINQTRVLESDDINPNGSNIFSSTCTPSGHFIRFDVSGLGSQNFPFSFSNDDACGPPSPGSDATGFLATIWLWRNLAPPFEAAGVEFGTRHRFRLNSDDTLGTHRIWLHDQSSDYITYIDAISSLSGDCEMTIFLEAEIDHYNESPDGGLTATTTGSLTITIALEGLYRCEDPELLAAAMGEGAFEGFGGRLGEVLGEGRFA